MLKPHKILGHSIILVVSRHFIVHIPSYSPTSLCFNTPQPQPHLLSSSRPSTLFISLPHRRIPLTTFTTCLLQTFPFLFAITPSSHTVPTVQGDTRKVQSNYLNHLDIGRISFCSFWTRLDRFLPSTRIFSSDFHFLQCPMLC